MRLLPSNSHLLLIESVTMVAGNIEQQLASHKNCALHSCGKHWLVSMECINCFCVTMVKTLHSNHLRKERFILACGFRVFQSIMERKLFQVSSAHGNRRMWWRLFTSLADQETEVRSHNQSLGITFRQDWLWLGWYNHTCGNNFQNPEPSDLLLQAMYDPSLRCPTVSPKCYILRNKCSKWEFLGDTLDLRHDKDHFFPSKTGLATVNLC